MSNFENTPQTVNSPELLSSLSELNNTLIEVEKSAGKLTVFEGVEIYNQTARGCDIDFKTIVHNTSELVLHLNKIHNGNPDLTIELVTRMSYLYIASILAINRLWFNAPEVFGPIFEIGNVVARISTELKYAPTQTITRSNFGF